jgi:asparagine N-glycosylation enzyme membrane subunit Stt3
MIFTNKEDTNVICFLFVLVLVLVLILVLVLVFIKKYELFCFLVVGYGLILAKKLYIKYSKTFEYKSFQWKNMFKVMFALQVVLYTQH